MADAETRPVAPQAADTSTSLAQAPLLNASSVPPNLTGQARINQMAADVQQNTDAAQAALASFGTQVAGLLDGVAKSSKEAADSAANIAQVEGLAKLKAQQAALSRANALGTNPDAANFVLDTIAEQYKQNNARAQKFSDRIADAMDFSNALDHPLTWFGNLLLFDFNKEGQASAERASQRSYQEYQGLNSMTQEDAKTQLAIAQGVTTATIADSAKLAALKFTKDAQQAELDKLKSGADFIIKGLQLQNTPFETERARQASENDAIRLQIARESAARQDSLTSLQIARERRADAREARQQSKFDAEEAAAEHQLQIINDAAKIRGVPMFFSSQSELAQAYKSPALRVKIDKLLELGLDDTYYKAQDVQAPGVVTMGRSPAGFIGTMETLRTAVNPGQAPILQLTRDVLKRAPQLQATPKNAAEAAEYEKTLNTAVETEAKRQYADITAGSNNIYAAPPLATFLQDANFVKGAPYLASTVFKTDHDLGNTAINFTGTVQQVVKGLRDKKLSLEQADSELGYLAAKVMEYNNGLRQYDVTAGLPRMKNVNIPVFAGGPVTRMFTGAEPSLDLANATKRQAYLAGQMASFIQPTILQQGTRQQGAK